jgi:hypothetical protein
MAASTAQALSDGGYPPSYSHCSIAIALNGRPVAINLGFIDKQTRKRHVRRRTEIRTRAPSQRKRRSQKGASTGIRMKVSEKGAVSIYGMGRFPVTLYKEQWLKLLDMSADIRAFIAANEAQLKTKD